MGLALGTSGADFRSRMKLRSENIKEQCRRKIVSYASILHRELVNNTPILTGQARANWQVSLDGTATGQPIGLGGPGGRLARRPPDSVPWGSYAADQQATIARFQFGQALYIFNNLPYIESLNAGSSAQAPAGYVEAAAMVASATYKAAA